MKKTIIILFILLTANLMVAQEEDKDNSLAIKICGKGYLTWPSVDAIEKFENSILSYLGFPESTPNKEKIISKFFNENNSKLICNDDSDSYIRPNEHILKRSLGRAEHDFLKYIANSSKYEIDWNFYEIVDGKKETMLDYIEKIINDPELAEDYNIPELKTLVRTIEGRGGKRGHELK